jgi:hypothetical protein
MVIPPSLIKVVKCGRGKPAEIRPPATTLFVRRDYLTQKHFQPTAHTSKTATAVAAVTKVMSMVPSVINITPS